MEDESEVKKLFIHFFLFKVSLVTLAFEFGLHKFQMLILGKKGQKETGKFSRANLAIFQKEVFAVVGVVTSCLYSDL